MNHRIGLVAAVIAGVAIGASGMGALQAQTAASSAYFVGNTEEVKDAATFAQYRAAAPKTEQAFGAHVIARGKPAQLDASELPKGDIVIIQFPSMKALMSWWNSPAYTAVRPLREKSTVGRIYAVDGLPAAP